MSLENTPYILKKECREQKLERVMVFNDRAELKRLVNCELKPGLNEVHVENVTHQIISDTVRVDGRGDGTIYDVQLRSKASVHEETDSPKAAQLREEIDKKSDEVNLLQDRESVLKKRFEALDKVIGEIGNIMVSHSKEQKESFALEQETLDNLGKFFGYHEKTSLEIRKEQRKVMKDLEKTQRELTALELQLNQELCSCRDRQESRSIIVTLESAEGGSVELFVSYQVHCAFWNPSYDVRVETGEKNSLKIVYYGNISQSTQEDWLDATVVLSTAQPSSGGQMPELGTLEAVIYRPLPTSPQLLMKMKHLKKVKRETTEECLFSSVDENDVDEELDAPMAAGLAAAAPLEPYALSTEFTVAKPAAIPSDGAEHKVTIGIIEVEPLLVHECVPSKNKCAFLTAFAVNSSELVFLPGDASVYLNNSFISKTFLKNISPGERFSCSLGVDAALRVDYKPVKKYHEQTGLITKSSSTVSDQLIVVRNSRSDPVLLTVKEPIPRSTDERIKIKLLNPSIPSVDDSNANNSEDLRAAKELPKEGAKMNGSTLEWTVSVLAGTASELHVKWTIEHPSTETPIFNDLKPSTSDWTVKFKHAIYNC